jgi:hypothetical protein
LLGPQACITSPGFCLCLYYFFIKHFIKSMSMFCWCRDFL